MKNIEDKIADITNLATNNTLNPKINEVKGEIHSITNLATTTVLNTKISVVKNDIPNITNLVTTTALTAVENKIPNVSNLGKKTDYNAKINAIEKKITTDHDHDKYITTQEFNKLTSENFAARLVQANLASKSDIASFVVTPSKPNNALVENKFKKSETFDLSLFIDQSYFFSDGVQIYFIFQLLCYTLKRLSNSEKVIL